VAELLTIALQSPWHFSGTIILIFATAIALEYVIRGGKKKL